VAGGAAFLIAAGLLLPGDRPRRRALVENGRRAIRLIGVSTLLLLVAGTLEGLVSPIEWWPIEGKLAVSGTTLVLLVTYLRLGRTPRPDASESDSRESDSSEPDSGAVGHGSTLALAPVTARRAP
jgi:hypothetical protein